MNITYRYRTQIVLIFTTIILVSIILITFLFTRQLKAIETANVAERLNVAQQTALDQIFINNTQTIAVLNQTNSACNLHQYIGQQNRDKLDSIMQEMLLDNPSIDYLTVTDAGGKVLFSTNDELDEQWYFSNLLNITSEKKIPQEFFEILPAEELKEGYGYLKEKAFVPYYINGEVKTNGVEDALLNLVLVPVMDSHYKFSGCLAAGTLLNNNVHLAETYTQKVPNTYLSVGFQGVRVSSNISLDNFHYPVGSMQGREPYETLEKGLRYNGKIPFPNNFALIVMDPLVNHEGKVIGNIGVGAPVTSFEELNNKENVMYICLTSLLIFLLTILLISFSSRSLTRPIFKLQQIARRISHNEISPKEIVWQEKVVSLEVQELANSIFKMAQNLDNDKSMLEERVNERTKQLVNVIAELESANKYKSQFLANMSHELRTPLTSIIGFSEMLKDPIVGRLDEKQEDYVDTIMMSSQHLLELINDLLVMIKLDQKVQKVVPQKINLQLLFNEVDVLFCPQLKSKNLELQVYIEKDLPAPYWDNGKIKQILINLVSNSIKFTPEGGRIILLAEKFKDKIKICVSDTGIGVPKGMQKKVFLAFEQADSSYTKQFSGAGLGLAITKSLVELHNGTIYLTDNEPKGTVITIILPVEPF